MLKLHCTSVVLSGAHMRQHTGAAQLLGGSAAASAHERAAPVLPRHSRAQNQAMEQQCRKVRTAGRWVSGLPSRPPQPCMPRSRLRGRKQRVVPSLHMQMVPPPPHPPRWLWLPGPSHWPTSAPCQVADRVWDQGKQACWLAAAPDLQVAPCVFAGLPQLPVLQSSACLLVRVA